MITYTEINNTLLKKHSFVDIAVVNRTETMTLVVLIVSVVSFYDYHIVKISMMFLSPHTDSGTIYILALEINIKGYPSVTNNTSFFKLLSIPILE